MLDQLLPVIFMAVLALVFGGGLLFIATLVGPKPKVISPAKSMPYESGIPGDDTADTKVPLKFYLTAIIFIVFDIEAVFIYPWATIFQDFIKAGAGVFILVEMGVFMLTLIFGLIYVWKSDSLDWK